MATYRVYKFRGHEYFFGIPLRCKDLSNSDSGVTFAHRFQLQGDLYLPESEWSQFHLYLARSLYRALLALYGGAISPYELHPGDAVVGGPPEFQDRVSVTTFVEPTSGDTEVVYRRARLRDRVFFFALSQSAEVEPGDIDLGPLTRPAPRPLIAPEVAAKFRKSEDCECQEPRFSAE